ncbi:hypothetical protein K9N50_03255 [bacterium]|nr:hypothetical protein [bacterium]
MSEENNRSCTNVKIGNLISQYELGLLNVDNQKLFEEHIFECAFCREELAEFRQVAELLSEHKDRLIEAIEDGELDYKEERLNEKQTRCFSDIIQGIKDFVNDVLDFAFRPKVLAPIMSVTVVFLVIYFGFITGENQSYEQFLIFEPLEYKQMILRSEATAEAENLFRQSMQSYNNGDYAAAANILMEAVKLDSANFKYKTYLGICYFLNKEPENALKMLTEAEHMTAFTLKDELHWYIFQSYLLNGDLTGADSVRSLIKTSKEVYSAKADSIWNLVNQHK